MFIHCEYLFILVSENMAVRESEEQKFRRSAHLTREEQYEEALRKSTYAFKRVSELGLTDNYDLYWFRE